VRRPKRPTISRSSRNLKLKKRGGKERYRLYGHKFSDVKDLVKAKYLKKEHYLDPEPEKVKKVII
jgi:hypothetical protein